MGKPKKIYIGPCEIAGYYRNLSLGLNRLGVAHDFEVYNSHPFGYGGGCNKSFVLKLTRWFNGFQNDSRRSILTKIIIALPGELLQSFWALYAIFHYDIFIFGFGNSLLRNGFDLPILRFLGKKVISNMAHGSEARPSYVDGALLSKYGHAPSTSKIMRYAKRRRDILNIHQKYCDVVIGAPFSTTQFASSSLINWFALGVPFLNNFDENNNLSKSEAQFDRRPSRSVRILHSPSHPTVKGTALIIKAIDNLKQRGYEIEFILIQNKPFKDVVEEIQRCDFVVDQIYSDTPMATFATESAWFGKPAIVGGYGLEQLKEFVPEGMWPPSKTCHPSQIEQTIEEMIVDAGLRERIGLEAQAFVRDKWIATEVARRYLRLIEDDIPSDWWLDPKSVVYLEGCGQSMMQSKEISRELVEVYGLQALQLSHRPELQNAFLKFAGVNTSD